MLVVETTHLKQGWVRRNGIPMSDRANDDRVLRPQRRHDDAHRRPRRSGVTCRAAGEERGVRAQRSASCRRRPGCGSASRSSRSRRRPKATCRRTCPASIRSRTSSATSTTCRSSPSAAAPRRCIRSSRRSASKAGADAAAGDQKPGGRAAAPDAQEAGRSWPTAQRRAMSLRVAAVAVVAVGAGAGARRQPRRSRSRTRTSTPCRSTSQQVSGNVYMLVGAGGNTTVFTRPGRRAGRRHAVRAAQRQDPRRRSRSSRDAADPLRSSTRTCTAITSAATRRSPRPGRTRAGGNVVGDIGAAATATARDHRARERAEPDGDAGGSRRCRSAALPTDTFFNARKDMLFNGEAVQMFHQPDAHTDGDIIVSFRRADVVATGDLFTTVMYPFIDAANGGTIDGYIKALNNIIDITVPSNVNEGGTMVIPGHGRLSDEQDVIEYRDMVTIVRDRIREYVKRGMTLEQVKAEKPTLDFDPRYGTDTGFWTTSQFIEAIYKEMVGCAIRRRSRRKRRSGAGGANERACVSRAARCGSCRSLSRSDSPWFAPRRSPQRAQGSRRAGGRRRPARRRPGRPHRHLGLGRHRGLAVADAARRRRATTRRSTSVMNAQARKVADTLGPVDGRALRGVWRRRPDAHARPSAHQLAGRHHAEDRDRRRSSRRGCSVCDADAPARAGGAADAAGHLGGRMAARRRRQRRIPRARRRRRTGAQRWGR